MASVSPVDADDEILLGVALGVIGHPSDRGDEHRIGQTFQQVPAGAGLGDRLFLRIIGRIRASLTFAEAADLNRHDYIARFFEKRSVPIDNLAINEIQDRIQGDYARFLNEGQKLVAYSGGEAITKQDVETLVSEPLEDDAFHLSNALSRGDVKNALRIYNDLKVFSAEPIALIRLLANQFRFLNEVRYLQTSGLTNSQIAGALQCSQMRVNISLDNLRKMSEETLNNALEGCYNCEKSILTGKCDPDLAFSLFLTNFSL